MKNELPRIQHVAALGELRLAIAFDDRRVVLVDFSETVSKGGVFERLSDPKFFAKFKLARNGRVLAWPGDLEFCADALHGEGVRRRKLRPTSAPFDARVFELA
jgi:Protein of unknown function (DUF2442)